MFSKESLHSFWIRTVIKDGCLINIISFTELWPHGMVIQSNRISVILYLKELIFTVTGNTWLHGTECVTETETCEKGRAKEPTTHLAKGQDQVILVRWTKWRISDKIEIYVVLRILVLIRKRQPLVTAVDQMPWSDQDQVNGVTPGLNRDHKLLVACWSWHWICRTFICLCTVPP